LGRKINKIRLSSNYLERVIALDILSLYDINAWIHDKYLYCVVCMDEKNYDKVYPIFGNVVFKKVMYCHGCNAKLLVKVADWNCVSCGTVNKYDEAICGGCDFVKGSKLRH
jgi:hypothetical protein